MSCHFPFFPNLRNHYRYRSPTPLHLRPIAPALLLPLPVLELRQRSQLRPTLPGRLEESWTVAMVTCELLNAVVTIRTGAGSYLIGGAMTGRRRTSSRLRSIAAGVVAALSLETVVTVNIGNSGHRCYSGQVLELTIRTEAVLRL